MGYIGSAILAALAIVLVLVAKKLQKSMNYHLKKRQNIACFICSSHQLASWLNIGYNIVT